MKTLRIRTLYEPNNPIYREFSQALVERFGEFLGRHGVLRLQVREHELVMEGEVLYRDEGTRDSLPFSLHRDGIREISFFEGLEPREVFEFLDTVKLDPTRDPASDDVLSRLWERDFVHVRYLFVDLFLDEEAIDLPAAPGAAGELGFAPAAEAFRVIDLDGEQEVDGRSILAEGRQAEILKLTPDDFDPTLYFLERDEVRRLQEEIEHEKERNLLLDYLELLQELILLEGDSPDVEPLQALEELHDYFFANGNLATVVRILDALAELARDARVTGPRGRAVEELRVRILSPESLARVAGMLEEEDSEDGALGAYLQRAAEASLGAAVERLGDLKRLAHREELLAPLVAAAAREPETLHRLFRHADPAVVKNAIFLSGRAPSRQSLEALEEPLHARDAEVRIEAINALKTYRTARAMDLLVEAVHDPDKLVRYYALRNLVSFNYRPALRTVLEAIRDREFGAKDLTERKLFFEAYGRFARTDAVPHLAEILSRKSLLWKGEARDLKVCAAVALGEIGGPAARALLEEHLADRQPEVREACGQALARVRA
ncbi:MAG: HEAT repeat domain-containing protein [Gemmatimonadota bacterium]